MRKRLSFKKLLTLICMHLLTLSFSTAQADVMGHVENHKIDGQVLNHTISPDGKFIYSTAIDPEKIFVHSRDPESGKLLNETQSLVPPATGTPFVPVGMKISPDGKQLYVTVYGGKLLQFDINNAGIITHKNTSTVYRPTSVNISDNGEIVYIGGAKSITVLKRAANGNLSIIQEVEKDKNDNEISNTNVVVLSPDNNQLYASSDTFDSRLYSFNINSDGTLTNTQIFMHKDNEYYPQTEDTKIEGAGGNGTIISEDGKFVYTAGRSRHVSDSISVFERATNGNLTFYKNVKSPEVSSTNTNTIIFTGDADLIMSPNQKYVYAFDRAVKILSVWKRNISTGDLTYLDKITGIDNIHSYIRMTTSPDERHLYLNAEGGIIAYDLRADMSLVKQGPSSDVAPDATMTYTLAATNNGPSDAYNVVIKDTLPAGTSFISGTVNSVTGGCSAVGQLVTCTLGTLFTDDGYNAVLKVKAPATDGTISNTATVSSNQLDTDTSNNTDSVTSTIKEGSVETSSSGGGSLPLNMIFLLISTLLYRRIRV